MIRVLADFHHDGLYHSLQLLFERRLGWELYRPIGLEWQQQGYWKIAEPYGNNPETIAQYLEIRRNYIPQDGTRPLNEVRRAKKGYFEVYAPYGNHKAVTLEQFKEMRFDFIVPTYLHHYHTFTKLRNKYQPQAKVVCQAGNDWLSAVDWSEVKNLMAACAPIPIPSGVNAIFYHEEFDISVYRPTFQEPKKVIRSFVNTLGQAELFKEDWKMFLELERLIPELKFESYGASCREGVITGDEAIARLMQESAFGFHLKTGGDGMGLVIHQWFACGRPPIVRRSQYKDKLAGQLMIDGLTCLDLDGKTIEGNALRIKAYANDEEEYNKLCKNAYKRFTEVVNFDEEFERIKKFLERAI